jgi:2-methylisocitrate lyase-like PEP mutase family enzyme
LEELGVARVSYGSMFLRVAAGAVKRAALEVLEQKTHELMSEAISGAEMRAVLESGRG